MLDVGDSTVTWKRWSCKAMPIAARRKNQDDSIISLIVLHWFLKSICCNKNDRMQRKEYQRLLMDLHSCIFRNKNVEFKELRCYVSATFPSGECGGSVTVSLSWAGGYILDRGGEIVCLGPRSLAGFDLPKTSESHILPWRTCSDENRTRDYETLPSKRDQVKYGLASNFDITMATYNTCMCPIRLHPWRFSYFEWKKCWQGIKQWTWRWKPRNLWLVRIWFFEVFYAIWFKEFNPSCCPSVVRTVIVSLTSLALITLKLE
jgi:hypothetical protein